MKSSYIVKISLAVSFAIAGPMACKEKAAPATQHGHHEAAVDSSVRRLTKPVNVQVIASLPVVKADSGTRIITARVNGVVTYDTRNQFSIASRVSGRIERLLVKYNYQPVRKGQLIMEIYSPDLAAAQREMLFVARNGGELLAAARQRLQLLGMQPGQIDQVLKTGSVMYRIPVYCTADGYILERSAAAAQVTATTSSAATGSGDGMSAMGGGAAPSPVTVAAAVPSATPVLLREGQYVSAGQSVFTVYNAQSLVAEFAFPAALAAAIRKGQEILFSAVANDNDLESARIDLIEPVFRDGLNFMRTRVYLKNSRLKAGQLLTANIPAVYSQGWWLPVKAVAHLGDQSVVFRKEKHMYVPVAVETGVTADGMIQVNTYIGNWEIASNAAYLVDSESFIKANH